MQQMQQIVHSFSVLYGLIILYFTSINNNKYKFHVLQTKKKKETEGPRAAAQAHGL